MPISTVNINRANLVSPAIQANIVRKHEQLSCGLINIRSLRNKLDIVDELIKDNKINIMAVTETWHEDSQCVTIGRLRASYSVIEEARRKPDSDNLDTINYVNHGGVALVADSRMQLLKLSLKISTSTFEYVCGRICLKMPIVFVVIYRPGSAAVTNLFYAEFEDMLSQLVIMSSDIYIVGDINIRLDRPGDSDTIRFNEILSSYGLTQSVGLPTHTLGGLLDVVVSREGTVVCPPTVRDVGVSDHSLIQWNVNNSFPALKYTSVMKQSWRSFSQPEFDKDLSQSLLCTSVAPTTWSSHDVTRMTDLYNKTFTDLLDLQAPYMCMKYRERASNIWFDDACRKAKTNIRLLERRYRTSNDRHDRTCWTDSLEKLHDLYRSKKSSSILRVIEEHKNSPRLLWNTLSETLGTTEEKLKYQHSADDFSSFFVQKVIDIRNVTLSAPTPSFDSTSSVSLSVFQPVSVATLNSIISSSPVKQSELDPVPTWLLKKSLHLIAPFITNLANASLSTASVPTSMKVAIVTPLLKKENLDLSVISNYRPVSNLSFISKVLEKIVKQQLTSYLESNNLLPIFQSAYRANHSTETALLRLYSDLVATADVGKVSLLALLDLSAAFDTVDHVILLERLSIEFGLNGLVLQWFKSYLSDRYQMVKCSGGTSAARALSCGVPQGSVLGPLLFMVYTAGLQKVIEGEGLSGYFYADDSQVRYSDYARNSASIRQRMENCILSISNWMASNRLKINPDKTELMWCGTSQQCSLVDSCVFQSRRCPYHSGSYSEIAWSDAGR
jgi:hypothetical protein